MFVLDLLDGRSEGGTRAKVQVPQTIQYSHTADINKYKFHQESKETRQNQFFIKTRGSTLLIRNMPLCDVDYVISSIYNFNECRGVIMFLQLHSP